MTTHTALREKLRKVKVYNLLSKAGSRHMTLTEDTIDAILRVIWEAMPEPRHYQPPKDTADHWGLTDDSIIRQLDNGKALGFNEFRSEAKNILLGEQE